MVKEELRRIRKGARGCQLVGHQRWDEALGRIRSAGHEMGKEALRLLLLRESHLGQEKNSV